MTLFVDTSVWSLASVATSSPIPRRQVGTIDTLLAQLCIRHKLTLLTTDKDFVRAASHCPLRVWGQDR